MDRLAPLDRRQELSRPGQMRDAAWHAFEAALKSGAVGATVKTE